MAVYQSEIKTISSSKEVVYDTLSNLESLAQIQSKEDIEGYVKIIDLSENACMLEIKQLGRVGMTIADKIAYDSIQFVFSELPVEVQAEIKLDTMETDKTAMQFVIQAELPKMLQFMLDKKLKQGVEILSDLFAKALNTNI